MRSTFWTSHSQRRFLKRLSASSTSLVTKLSASTPLLMWSCRACWKPPAGSYCSPTQIAWTGQLWICNAIFCATQNWTPSKIPFLSFTKAGLPNWKVLLHQMDLSFLWVSPNLFSDTWRALPSSSSLLHLGQSHHCSPFFGEWSQRSWSFSSFFTRVHMAKQCAGSVSANAGTKKKQRRPPYSSLFIFYSPCWYHSI